MLKISSIFLLSLLVCLYVTAYEESDGNVFATPACTLPNGSKGACFSKSLCKGTTTPGYCPGAADIQCCTSTCTTPSGTGTCQTTGSCKGKPIPGYCGGPSDVQCCVTSSSPSPTPNPSPGGRTTNKAGLDLIKEFEGFYPNFYIDPVGIKTIGYGHACHVNDCNNLQAKNANGVFRRVYPPLSKQDGEDLLRADLQNHGYEACVNKYVTRSSLTSNQFSSLVSFAFNVGCGALQSSTLLKRVNSNAPLEGPNGIRDAFLMWVKGGGKVLPGLVRRRNAEADLYGRK